MDIFSAAPHHDILLLVIQISVLLFAARALGEVAQRLGQPSVVGEILAGIILGPSVLVGIFPELGQWIIPQTETQGYLLEVVSLIGAVFLLLITGLETDIKLIKRHARTAAGVSFGGIIVTFASGFVLGQFLPDFLLADTGERLVFSLFVATALSISAIPVISKVLMDLNLMRRDIGQTILAAGMSDDTIGWILLSIVAGLASGESVTVGSVLQIVGSVLAFMLVSFTLGRWMVRKLLTYVQDEIKSTDRILTLVIILTFAWGAITQALHLEAVLGAFVMGILFGMMPRLPEDVIHKLESIALGIFAPIFFAVAGLKVNILNLLEPILIVITLIVIAVATLGKIAGTYMGARVIGGKDHWTSLSFGAGLNARGAMEIIIATIGLNLGILGQDMFSIIVVMAMATSLMAPSALRWVLGKVEVGKEEEERLKQEELEAESLVAGIHRVLLPVRGRDVQADKQAIQSVEAQLLELLGQKTELSLTLFTVAEKGNKSKCEEYLKACAKLFNQKEIVTKVVEEQSAGDTILDEAKKDYDLMVLGATEYEKRDGNRHLFSPLVDYLVRVAPCPTLIVRSSDVSQSWYPARILVPSNGTIASKNAADLGFFIAKSDDRREVTVLNVVLDEHSHSPWHIRDDKKENQVEIARGIVAELKDLGEAMDVKTQAVVEQGESPELVIQNFAKDNEMDLIILGTNVRPGSHRLYLGPRVETILQDSSCPVIIFNT
ncbi:cation:proton antiporter [Aliifodinibius sp. S!AR15-10]|uniref:cation:proton antiporter domain-containing protein n=1 Tax=Aliifodinibius sp. S!AR15-10 TaxID=2950437 RepID=UPI002856C63B|nr:cation:proton antiporter [Aliifodinibius sp. S!AR15-10]MDR8392198.1 cation:proton antiporter [Aliifodinibius sp. S!AR15-10]